MEEMKGRKKDPNTSAIRLVSNTSFDTRCTFVWLWWAINKRVLVIVQSADTERDPVKTLHLFWFAPWIFGSWGTGLCTCSVPSQPLAHPSLLAEGAERDTEKALVLYKHCSAVAKTLVCYQPCFSHWCKTLHCTSCCDERKLHPWQTQYST